MNKEEIYTQLRELDAELKQMNGHLENIDEQLAEITANKNIVEKFKELKKGDELRVPIVSGVYIKAKLEDTKNLMINVGTGVTVEKSPEKVQEIFSNQLKEMTEYRETLLVKQTARKRGCQTIPCSLDGNAAQRGCTKPTPVCVLGYRLKDRLC